MIMIVISLQMLARILLLVGFVSGQGRVPLHSLMTEEELRFYFGDRVKICPLLMMKENVDEFPFSI